MVSQNPFVSIVTPVYNGEIFLHACIRSVLDQTYQNWEYVIVDNCSKDATPDILREYSSKDDRIRVVRNPELIPPNANWNTAFASISPDSIYCQMLHADDLILPEYLARKVELAEQHPRMGMIGCLADADGTIWGRGLPNDQQSFSGREIARQTLSGQIYPFIAPSVLLLRSEVVRSRQPYYPNQIHGDVSACYEVLRSWDFGMVHEVLTQIGVHENTLSNTVAKPLQRFWISNLDLLLTYGPEFMQGSEFNQRKEQYLDGYYRFLAQAKLEGRDDSFWKFHADEMRSLTVPLSGSRLARAVTQEVLQRPRASLGRLRRRLLPAPA